ncbi:HPF/RaiA family ribosome-associated protein [uncultured Winogradskyella sp.]|uniref:HPF/RaiA family ribosome-associated protein n=1 Tax=uncultured Winogradskyella sp. TaxID=395353 RepID=UPI0026270BF4|nr:HPF/RaiA family ribosome-associated protein [uncultured Winogradskyella sp.]
MTVNFQYVNTDVSETLSQFTKEKLEKLNNKFEFLISAQVYFKHDDKDHQAGKICNIELSLPGPRIFAKSNEREYELAVSATINDLRRQLEKRKEVYKVY